MSTIGKTIKKTIGDPGFGFAVSGVVLFAQTSPIGLAAMTVAATCIAGITALKSAQPEFLQKDNALTRLIRDERTPLNMLATAASITTVATLAVSGLTLAAIVPALAAASFAIGDFMLAAQIGRAASGEIKPDSRPGKMSFTKFAVRAVRSPEPYFTKGLMLAGLMAGGWSAVAFPLLLAGCAVTLASAAKGKPEYAGHPKLYYAAATSVFGIVGLASGNWTAAIANIIDAPYLAICEAQVTPGGMRQVMKDVRTGFANLLHKKPSPVALQPVIELTAPASAVSLLPSLKKEFSATGCAATAQASAAAPATSPKTPPAASSQDTKPSPKRASSG